MKTVWRVDGELLTLAEVEYNEQMLVGVWLPALYGGGAYAYLEQHEDAKNTLVGIINNKIKELEELRSELEGENK